jgi:DNA-binding response OmpR family regulator
MSGLDLIRRIREQQPYADVAALAITGYGTATDRSEALAAGFDGHVVKPIEIDELDRVIRALTRKRTRARE